MYLFSFSLAFFKLPLTFLPHEESSFIFLILMEFLQSEFIIAQQQEIHRGYQWLALN